MMSSPSRLLGDHADRRFVIWALIVGAVPLLLVCAALLSAIYAADGFHVVSGCPFLGAWG